MGIVELSTYVNTWKPDTDRYQIKPFILHCTRTFPYFAW